MFRVLFSRFKFLYKNIKKTCKIYVYTVANDIFLWLGGRVVEGVMNILLITLYTFLLYLWVHVLCTHQIIILYVECHFLKYFYLSDFVFKHYYNDSCKNVTRRIQYHFLRFTYVIPISFLLNRSRDHVFLFFYQGKP